MQKFNHKKANDRLKLGITFSILANICLYSFISAKFYPFTKSDTDFFPTVREDMAGGQSIVFTRTGVVDENQIRKSTTVFESLVGIDACQIYPYSVGQPLPT